MTRRALLASAGFVVALALMSIPLVQAQNGPRIGHPAPEITGGPWINSPPLSLDKLRGRVVFVEFWTYG